MSDADSITIGTPQHAIVASGKLQISRHDQDWNSSSNSFELGLGLSYPASPQLVKFYTIRVHAYV